MDPSLRIQIELHLLCQPTTHLPAWLLVKSVSAVDNAILASELNDLRQLRKQLPDLPTVALDAAEKRLGAYRGSGLLVERAESGSLVVIGVVAGLSIFVLQNTLGETLKEAWLESDGSRRLKALLFEQRSIKAFDIAGRP